MSRILPAAFLLIMGISGLNPSVGHGQDWGQPRSTYVNGMLVTDKDVTTCPYEVLAAVSVNARQDFGSKSLAAIYQKLRDKAAKIHADAVILVTVGDEHMTLLSMSQRNATGRAIRYLHSGCEPRE